MDVTNGCDGGCVTMGRYPAAPRGRPPCASGRGTVAMGKVAASVLMCNRRGSCATETALRSCPPLSSHKAPSLALVMGVNDCGLARCEIGVAGGLVGLEIQRVDRLVSGAMSTRCALDSALGRRMASSAH